jgi:hypothetical protein
MVLHAGLAKATKATEDIQPQWPFNSTHGGMTEVTWVSCLERPAVGAARRASGRLQPEQSKSTVLCSSWAPRWALCSRAPAHGCDAQFYYDTRDLGLVCDVPALRHGEMTPAAPDMAMVWAALTNGVCVVSHV